MTRQPGPAPTRAETAALDGIRRRRALLLALLGALAPLLLVCWWAPLERTVREGCCLPG